MSTAGEAIKQVSILIPAYNEEDNICRTVTALANDPRVSEIVVIDDGSWDNTAELAAKAGARVLQLPRNLGKGGALTWGILAVTAEIVLLLDADLQESAPLALRLLDPVLADESDLTIARFPPEKRGNGFGFARKTAAWGIRFLTGVEINAPLSGQRCARREVFQKLLPLAPRFGLEVGMTIDALQKGYRIKIVDLPLEHRPPGRDWRGFLHRGRQMIDICSTLVKRLRR